MSRFKDKEKKGYRKLIILVIVFAIVAVTVTVTLLTVPRIKELSTGKIDVEKEMTSVVTKYYEENIKGKVIGINKHKIMLKAVKDKGIDVNKLLKKSKVDIEKTYSYVIVENPKEKDKEKIKYTIENHINGEE